MHRTTVRRTADGLVCLEGTSRLRRAAIAATLVALGAPAALMVVVAVVAVLPFLALAAPTAALIVVAGLTARSIQQRRRRGHHGRAQVLLLHRTRSG